MLRPATLIILASFALILSVNALEESNQSMTCVQLGDTCDLHRHCCETLKCEWSNALGRSECKKKSKLGDLCGDTFPCIDILHSVCSKKKCVCREKTVKVNDYNCAPLLNGYCWKNETCATDNSQCIVNECQCRDGFFAQSGMCLPVVLGSPCSDDAACAGVKYSQCSTNNICTCANNTIATSSQKCLLTLGGTCEFDRDCVANFWCADKKCQCRDQRSPRSNMKCELAYIGMPCKRSRDCISHFSNSRCFDYVCQCKPKFVLQNGNECIPKISSSCKTDDECLGLESFCTDRRCQCRPNYVMRESECLPTQLKGRCRTTLDCSEVKFSECLNGHCYCPDGFYSVNATSCAKALGGSCVINQDCSIKFAYCSDKVCRCNKGYMQYSKNQCTATELGTTCSDDNTCGLIKYARCFEGQCSCMDNYIELNSYTCTGMLNATCYEDSECALNNSVCIDFKCQCKLSYYPMSKYECVLVLLEQRCHLDKDCIGISFAKCSDAEKCICHKNYLRVGPTTCSPTLGGYCNINRDCVTVNAECSSHECRCSAGYVQRSANLCLPVFLGQICGSNEDCDVITNAKCIENKCQCIPGFTKFDRRVCLPLIGGNCREHKECAVYNSNCVDNKCQCLETFVPQSQSKCVSTGVDGICYTDIDCELPNTQCSRFQYCVCNQNYISSNGICVPILGASCSETKSCVTTNSECIDRECQCSQGFVRGLYNDCLPILLGFACKTDFDCKNIQKASCIDAICVCKPNKFALTSSTCTNLLNVECFSSDDCGIDSSYCIDNKCQCMFDSVALADTMCEKRSALNYCDNALDCGEPWHSRCLKNRCVCNSKHIAVHARICLPILDGNCWRDDQCNTENSICSGYRCQCRPGFITVAGNMCVPAR